MSTALLQGYIEAQAVRAREHTRASLPFITMSREAGAGAVTIGRLVAEHLNQRKTAPHEPPWTIFDRNLVERVLDDHELPRRIRQFLPEDAIFDLKDAVEELLGLHPSNWTLVQHTTDTILRLARLGNVILVGRGSNVITAKMPGALHVRLVAPVDARIDHIAELHALDHSDATRFVAKTDRARRRYLKRHFDAAIHDPLLYDATFNTGRLGFENVARLIAEAVTLSPP